MNYSQTIESTHVFGLLTSADVLEQKRPAMSLEATRGPDQKPSMKETM